MFGTTILEERISKYNGRLRVVRSWGMGTYIQSDGLTQSGGVVEGMWRQTLKQILNSKLQITNCLILGLGGGTVVKLINDNWPEAKITGVDIDPIIVELGEKYLGLDKFKVNVKISDAKNFLVSLITTPDRNSYDLIIVDLYNGDNFPKRFESQNYIHLLRSLLGSGGIIVFNRLYYKDKKILAEKFGKRLKKFFNNVEYYHPAINLMLICRV